MKAFKAYDIRGIYNQDFNADDVYKIGYFIPRLLKTSKILVGRDVRISSDEIFERLTCGMNDAGADVYNCGLATTPMVYFGTAHFGFDASVQITASHNPREYNGLKISKTLALPVGYDEGLNLVEKWMQEETIVPVPERGKIYDIDVKTPYLAFLQQYQSDLSNLHIGVDCSNGMAALFIKEFLGQEPVYIYDDLDGTFPNHEANPLEPENVKDLQRLVIEQGCDIGVIFDGDADRVMFVDDKGKFISPDLMIALLGHYFIEEKGLKGNVLQDIRTSKAVTEYLEKMGATVHMWKVGRAFAAPRLREIDGIFGGELAGHYYFKDFFYSDSGILACLLILRIVSKLKRQGQKLSSIIEKMAIYANSGELNFRINNKSGAMEAVKNHFLQSEKSIAGYDFDGFRIEFNDWWFNIRPSNTEPYLRLIAEARTQELLNKKIETIKSILAKF